MSSWTKRWGKRPGFRPGDMVKARTAKRTASPAPLVTEAVEKPKSAKKVTSKTTK